MVRRRDFAYAASVGLVASQWPRGLQAAPCPPPSLQLQGEDIAGTSCSAGGVPVWYSSLVHKQWASPVNNTFGTTGVLDPNAEGQNRGSTGPESIINTWTGMVCDSDNFEIALINNGGHNDYYGNEVYSCDLSQSSPVWVRRRSATIFSGSGTAAVLSDGRPASDHTANLPVAAEGRWFLPGMTAFASSGNSGRGQWWEFSRTTNDYINLGNGHPNGGGALQVYGTAACWDPIDRQVIVGFLSGNISVLFHSIDSMSSPTPAVQNTNAIWGSPTGSPFMSLAVDTTNRVLLAVIDGTTPRALRINSTANKQAAWTNLSVSGSPPPSASCMHWHPASNAFITWDMSGQSLRKFTPTVSSGMYTGGTWSTVTTGFSGVTPPGVSYGSGTFRGMFSKINLMAMADGSHALVTVPRYSTNPANKDMFVCKLTAAV